MRSCRECCRTSAANIEVSVFEFLPLSIHLWRREKPNSGWPGRLQRRRTLLACFLMRMPFFSRKEGAGSTPGDRCYAVYSGFPRWRINTGSRSSPFAAGLLRKIPDCGKDCKRRWRVACLYQSIHPTPGEFLSSTPPWAKRVTRLIKRFCWRWKLPGSVWPWPGRMDTRARRRRMSRR